MQLRQQPTLGKPNTQKPRPAVPRTAVLLAVCLVSGCLSQGSQTLTRPERYEVRSEQLFVMSDFRLPQDHPLILDLVELRKQVAHSLDLPLEGEPVVVYLFQDEPEYRSFLEATYPDLPPRRAYFVGTPKELAVYTFWGDRIQEDLRHEFTHGLLHASIHEVPLWIDEGLAEYFEVAGSQPGEVNTQYVTQLTTAFSNDWRPNLERLESLTDFSQMQRIDYQESWAWVHFMLHSTPDAREALLAYIADLRSGSVDVPLSERLQENHPQVIDRFTNYVASLQGLGTQISSLP